ncbi:hypothetical protein SCALM49S_06372 [Streptomyces californicus]
MLRLVAKGLSLQADRRAAGDLAPHGPEPRCRTPSASSSCTTGWSWCGTPSSAASTTSDRRAAERGRLSRGYRPRHIDADAAPPPSPGHGPAPRTAPDRESPWKSWPSASGPTEPPDREGLRWPPRGPLPGRLPQPGHRPHRGRLRDRLHERQRRPERPVLQTLAAGTQCRPRAPRDGGPSGRAAARVHLERPICAPRSPASTRRIVVQRVRPPEPGGLPPERRPDHGSPRPRPRPISSRIARRTISADSPPGTSSRGPRPVRLGRAARPAPPRAPARAPRRRPARSAGCRRRGVEADARRSAGTAPGPAPGSRPPAVPPAGPPPAPPPSGSST